MDKQVEDRIFRMNDFMLRMGFNPMKASEIEPLLKRFSQRQAIRGINKAESSVPPAVPMPMNTMGPKGGM